MSHKCYSIAFKLRAVSVEEAQSYLFPSVVSGLLSYKWWSRVIDGLEETPVQNLQVRNRCRSLYLRIYGISSDSNLLLWVYLSKQNSKLQL